MSQIPVKSNPPMAEGLRKIPQFAKRYAQHRSIGMLISLAFFAATFVGISGASYFPGMAYRAGNELGLVIASAILLLALAACVWLSVPKWGGKLISQLTSQFYAPDGNIGLETSRQLSQATLGALAGFLWVGTVLIVILGLVDVLPIRLAVINSFVRDGAQLKSEKSTTKRRSSGKN